MPSTAPRNTRLVATAPILLTLLVGCGQSDEDRQLQNILTTLSETAYNIKVVTARVALVLDDQNRAALSETLTNVNAISASLNRTLGEIETRVPALLDDVQATTSQAPALVGQAAAVLAEIEEAAASLNRTVASLETTVQELQTALGEVPTVVSSVSRTATNLEEASAGVTRTVEGVEGVVGEVGQVVGEAGGNVVALTRDTPGELNQALLDMQALSESLRGLVEELRTRPNSLVFGRSAGVEGPGE